MISKLEIEVYDQKFAIETLEKELKNVSADLEQTTIDKEQSENWAKLLEGKLNKTKAKKKES